MSWVFLSLLSALLLGGYDIAKKKSLRDNAVPAVLLANVTFAALIWLPIIIAAVFYGSDAVGPLADIACLDTQTHLLLFMKSAIVGASWTCAFFALKHLPISIAAPIRGSSPLITIAIAVMWMGESPTIAQWFGIAIVLGAFFAFSRIGAGEGVHFHRDRWVTLMIAATILGGASALYDKYLLQTKQLSPWVVQSWFSVYLVPVTLPMAVHWYFKERKSKPFQWRWSIPFISILLLTADITYFFALRDPEALIAIISPLRRTSVIVAFLYGILFLNEQNAHRKSFCIIVLLIGVVLLSL